MYPEPASITSWGSPVLVTMARWGARVVSDLLADREDEPAVARIVQDALHVGLLTRAELEKIVTDHVAAYGAPSTDALSATLAGSWR